MLLAGVDNIRMPHERVEVDLVEHGQLHAVLDHLVDVLGAKVANTDRLDEPLVPSGEEGSPDLLSLRRTAQGRVHQVQVEVVQPRLLQRVLQVGQSQVVRPIPHQLGRDEDLRSGHARRRHKVAHGAADRRLILVPDVSRQNTNEGKEKKGRCLPLRSVYVSVSILECGNARIVRRLVPHLIHAQPKLGDLVPIAQLCVSSPPPLQLTLTFPWRFFATVGLDMVQSDEERGRAMRVDRVSIANAQDAKGQSGVRGTTLAARVCKRRRQRPARHVRTPPAYGGVP